MKVNTRTELTTHPRSTTLREMRIDVSGHSFVFPDECACCGDAADAELGVSATKTSGKRVVHRKTNAWDIPYCGRCVGHVKSAQAARMFALLLGFSSIVVGAFLWYAVNPGIGILGGSVTLLGATLGCSMWMSEARARCSSACVCVGSAVAYLGWHGTLHKFDVKSASFARDFMTANRSKLVNLSPQARNVLANAGTVSNTNAPRTPRRYQS
jgi:hypothetical protein